MRFVHRQMRSRRAKGLSVPQFRTLVQLRRNPSASLSGISENLGSSLPTTSRIVSGLVTKGLITRRASATDRRQISLHLTSRGQAVIDAAWSGTQDALAEKLSDVSAERLTAMTKDLTLLTELFACAPVCPREGGGNGSH